MMQKRRVVLTFPQDMIGSPVIYRLVKDYDLILNILRAQVSPEEGKMVELYRYRRGGTILGTVRIVDGTVDRVDFIN